VGLKNLVIIFASETRIIPLGANLIYFDDYMPPFRVVFVVVLCLLITRVTLSQVESWSVSWNNKTRILK